MAHVVYVNIVHNIGGDLLYIYIYICMRVLGAPCSGETSRSRQTKASSHVHAQKEEKVPGLP